MADRDKKRIVCTPDAEDRIRQLVTDHGLDEHFTVHASTLVPTGRAFILQSDAEFEADMQQLAAQLHAELAETIRQQMEQDAKNAAARLRFAAEIRQCYAIGLQAERSPFGMVTGL